MYCPKCGTENQDEAKFCRVCGLKMDAIAEVVSSELSSGTGERSIQHSSPRQSVWSNPVVYGFLIMMLGVVIAIIGKRFVGEKVVADIGTLVSVLGVGLLGLKGVLMITHPAKSLPQSKPPELPREADFKPAALPSVPHASVTEHTTRQLEPEPSTPRNTNPV